MSSQRGPHRVVLEDFKAAKRDEGAIDIVVDGGEVFRVDPPQLWPDEATQMATQGNFVAMGELIMGEGRFGKFAAAGGSGMLLGAIVMETLGLSPGNFAASSTS